MKFFLNLLAVLVLSIYTNAQQLDFEIYYKENKFELTEEKKTYIKNKLYETYGKDYEIFITSYTDNKGSIAYNQRLSELRAQQTFEFVRSLGLNVEILEREGKGEYKPYDGAKEMENPEHRKSVVKATYKPVTGKEKLRIIEERIKNAYGNFKESEELMKAFNDLNKGIIKGNDSEFDTSIKPESTKDTVVISRVDTVFITKKDTVVVIQKIETKLDKLEVGQAVAFKKINFKPNKAKFISGSYEELEEILKTMKYNPKLKIEIQGHVCCGKTDDKKEKEFIDRLSFERAKAVNDYLEKNGIEETRMEYVGKGFSEPLIKEEKTLQDELQNRRVEIKVLSK